MASNGFGDIIGTIGHALRLPEFGISEALGGTNNFAQEAFGQIIQDKINPYTPPTATRDFGEYTTSQPNTPTYNAQATQNTQAQSDTLASLADQRSQLQGLLGRTEVGLSQGLTRNENDYNTEVGGANDAKALQYGNFADKRLSNNEDKQSAFGKINRNANAGYRSLAQIIGRASGTGSSAFRDLLPNVIGQDTSSKRRAANENFGRNLQGIDKAQGQYDISFESVLADLLKQKKDNEATLRTGVEGQRQGINSQLAQNAAQDAQARGGGFAAVRAASQPFQDSINSSRDTVQSFFDQFRTPFAQKQAVAPTPELSQYTTDRSVVNQQAQGGGDASNPYAQLLRKRLQQA